MIDRRTAQVWWLIALVTLIRAAAAATGPLIDDEAYYWLWSRRLDWGYLDHPPAIAYLIALGTIPGDGALWLRLPALLLGAATSYTLFVLGRALFDERSGLLAAALFQVVPVLAGGGLLSTPDAPLFVAWTAAMHVLWQAMHGRRGRWPLAGLLVGLGLLSKLYMALFAVGAGLYIVLHTRGWLRRAEPYVAAALALTVFGPVLYWNATHGWAMVRFILSERPAGTPTGVAGISELLVQQLAFVLFLFPVYVWAAIQAWRRRRDLRYAYVFWISIPALAFAFAAAAASGAPHGNWTGPAYLGLSLIVGARWSRRIAVPALGNAALVAIGFLALWVPGFPPPPGTADLVGWREAAARVRQEVSALGDRAVVVADRYQVAAQLGYYTGDTIPVTILPRPNPGSIWPAPQQFAGRDAVTALDARWSPGVPWERCFDRVEEKPSARAMRDGRLLRTIRILRLYRLARCRTE